LREVTTVTETGPAGRAAHGAHRAPIRRGVAAGPCTLTRAATPSRWTTSSTPSVPPVWSASRDGRPGGSAYEPLRLRLALTGRGRLPGSQGKIETAAGHSSGHTRVDSGRRATCGRILTPIGRRSDGCRTCRARTCGGSGSSGAARSGSSNVRWAESRGLVVSSGGVCGRGRAGAAVLTGLSRLGPPGVSAGFASVECGEWHRMRSLATRLTSAGLSMLAANR
jgi:hypothetical protein